MKNTEDIIVAHLHDEASADEVRRLFAWIREEPENAEEFARCALLHAQLRGQLCGEKRAREADEFATRVDPTQNTELESTEQLSVGRTSRKWSRLRFSIVLAGSIAASVVFALGLFLSRPQEGEPVALQPKIQVPFVTISQTVDVEWDGERDLNKGDRIAAATLDLRDGFVRLGFDSGVEVTLQGPAKLELMSPEHAKLTSGLLTATVPPGAEGFRVDTPNAQVVDLGTAFGIHLDNNGVSRVSVFDGEVDVALPGSGEKLLLKEGESVRVEDGEDIETADFDTAPYAKIWPISSGIERSTGAFRFTPAWPRRLRFVRSDDEIFVAPEGYVTTLDRPLKVNVSAPGEYFRAEEVSVLELPAGRAVRSFILHFHPRHDGRRRRFKRTTGSITFDRPVLGLIVLHEELAASATRFPGRRAGETLRHRQLELTGHPVGDLITLSDDRRTVGLDLAAPRRFSDLVRVIVDASNETPAVSD
ncbi:MAG: FecR domain-containing protein [Planctomycetaceae bacterium]|nr:FecR domain-containing protein [Planctomycetaceae bacterium]